MMPGSIVLLSIACRCVVVRWYVMLACTALLVDGQPQRLMGTQLRLTDRDSARVRSISQGGVTSPVGARVLPLC
jgi:hypothetical protein